MLYYNKLGQLFTLRNYKPKRLRLETHLTYCKKLSKKRSLKV